jgi:hypothetical protein
LEYYPEELVRSKKQESRQESKKVTKPDAKRPGRPVPAAGLQRWPDVSEYKPSQSRGGCLKCGSKQHSVRQCHQVAEREAEKLIQEYRSKKERETGVRRVQRVQCPNNPKIDPNKIVSAKLEGCLEAKLLLDTGADVSLMPRGLLEKLEQEAEFLKVKKLSEPVEIGTAGSKRISVHRKILLESVVLETSAGHLRWRNEECYVNEADNGTLCIISSEEAAGTGE